MIKPKILIISTRFPLPVMRGGDLRIVELAKEISTVADVDLICFSRKVIDSKSLDTTPFQNVFFVKFNLFSALFRLICAIPRKLPFQVALYASSTMSKQVENLLPCYSIVIGHMIRCTQFIPRVKTITRIAELTDAISLNYARTAEIHKNILMRVIYRIESKRVKEYELTTIKTFDKSYVVSPVDLKYFCNNLQTKFSNKIELATVGLDLAKYKQVSLSLMSNIGFVGSMGYLPNIDACQFFIEDIFPLIRKKIPNLRFVIVGRGPNRILKKFSQYDGVDVLGEVNSVAEEIKNCFAVIAPLRIGAGIQTKVLEYMALGVPAVVTDICSAPIGGMNNVHYLVANTPAEIAACLLDLYTNPNLRADIVKNARELIVTRFSSDVCLRPYKEYINSVILSNLNE